MTDLTRAPGASRLDLKAGTARHAVRHARWHSVFVRYLRHFIIAGCTLVVLAVGFLIFFNPFRQLQKNLSSTAVGLKGTVVTLSTPKMRGIRQNGAPFELTGASGTQDILNPSIVNLAGVDAKVGLDDRTTARITSLSGIYDSTRNYVWLNHNVRIKNDDAGYDMFTQKAEMDFASGKMITDTPVKLLLSGGSVVNADHMTISDNGHKISFLGHVHSLIDPSDANTGATPPAEAQP
ncbi:LPS export ABC transporter periplasmic protein LptC [uncultured Methylovirgula sp.]|uniref:LPS export ABC transporter periplasmic protein LptC n=1 Tax=uncultured Methylovirgula sp. TaxID=1285960 RepID=UPI00262F0540|nr:LPS export ABC transporter periplasmic protein LptC [uncultured Methylovirgula sp.]